MFNSLRKTQIDELKKNPRFCIVCFRDNSNVDRFHVCEKCRKGSAGMPRRLPVVTLDNGKTYFVDERYCQRPKTLPKSPVENVTGSIAEHTNANPPKMKAEICIER